MRTDSAVAAYAISPEDHWTFLAGLAEGKQGVNSTEFQQTFQVFIVLWYIV